MLMQVAFRRVRSGLFIMVGVWTALSLVGCAGRSLNEQPPKNVDLSGDWQLNAALSDDVQKALQAQFKTMRDRSERERGERGYTTGAPMRRPSEGMSRRTESDETQSQEERDPEGMGKIFKQREERFSSMIIAPIRMHIALKGAQFIVKHDDTSDEFHAGTRSVVSFGNDVADRTAGWRGKEFIVSTRGVDGGAKEERYSLAPDGRLSLITRLTGDRMPNLEIKRIYDRGKS
jgi:hypothetical protein